jgi:hypothetical protein
MFNFKICYITKKKNIIANALFYKLKSFLNAINN